MRTTAIRISLVALGLSLITFALSLPIYRANAGGGRIEPAIIEREMPHAWCYVMLNDNNAVGDINMLSCVPK